MKLIKAIIVLVLVIAMTSCNVLQQASEISRLSKCEFRLYTVENITLAGINFQHVDSYDDLNLMDVLKISSAVTKDSLPLLFRLNVQARNPNSGVAAMNRMDWVLYIDDNEITQGLVNERIEIPPDGGVTTIPVGIHLDLMEVLTGESADAVINFALNLAGTGNRPTRIMLKAKPTIYVNGQAIEYPGYIKIKTEFTSL